jgi:hypothetical protein
MRMRPSRVLSSLRVLRALGAVVLGAACTPPPDVTPEPGSTQSRYIEAYCGVLERCQATWGQLYIDGAACRAYLADTLRCGVEIQTGQLRLSVPMSYDETHGQACIRWLDGLACDTADVDNADCDAALVARGARAEGESCESSATTIQTCGPGLYCKRQSSDSDCDLCQAEAAAGQACSDSEPRVPCSDGHYCNAASHLCSPQRPDASACNSDGECTSGWCKDLVCTAKLARDAPCVDDDRCDKALRCAGGRCIDRVAPGLGCESSADCLQPAVCLDGTCARVGACERPTAGNACIASCADGAFCDDNQCRAFAGAGESCDSHAQCGFPEGICQSASSTCLLLAAVGETCGTARPCQPYAATCDSLTDPQNPICVAARPDGQPCSDATECESFYCHPASDTCGDRALLCAMP